MANVKLREFFEQTTVNAFFRKRATLVRRKRVFTIDKAIVGVIMREFMIPNSNARGDDDSASGLRPKIVGWIF